jgi:hypothetical protein
MKWLFILLGVAVGIKIIMVAVSMVMFMIGVHFEDQKIKQREHVLVYEIDHQSLYDACLEIKAHPEKYRHNPNSYGGTPGELTSPDPKDPKMPEVIRSLHAFYIVIGSDRVHIQLGGGFYHYGITAYSPGIEGSGTKQLVPGLWYEAEDGYIPEK